jgi:PsbN protein
LNKIKNLKSSQTNFIQILAIGIIKTKYFYNKAMEIISFFSAIFIACTLISMTLYSVYIGFGPNSTNLRDPFEEHED